MSATSDNSVITEAKAGGAATGGSGVGIGGAIAISVVSNDTQAVLGSGGITDRDGQSERSSHAHGQHNNLGGRIGGRIERGDRDSAWPERSERHDAGDDE